MARDEYFPTGRSVIPKKRVPVFRQDHIQLNFSLVGPNAVSATLTCIRRQREWNARLFTACLHAALSRLRTRANDWPMKRGRRKHRPQFDQRVGKEGQLSNPEQNEMVAEAAGPSQHLLPASSKAASGTSKLSVSSSKSAVIDSVMMDHPFLRPIKDNQKRKTSQIVLWALARDGIGGKSWIATDGHGGGTCSVIGFSVSQILAVTFLRVWRLFCLVRFRIIASARCSSYRESKSGRAK